MAKSLTVDTESHSLDEVSKFILSNYVERTTGRPHDRCVSGLIAAVVNSPEYTEVAYRMWRNRNYDRLERHFSWITDLLVGYACGNGTPSVTNSRRKLEFAICASFHGAAV